MTDTAVLMLGMPFAMLSTFSAIVAVLGLALAAGVILLGLGFSATQKILDWSEARQTKKAWEALAADWASELPAWASPEMLDWQDDQWWLKKGKRAEGW